MRITDRNKAEKKKNKKIKQKSITTRLMRAIAAIMLITVMVPIIAYNTLPDWVYYIASGTRLWLAMDTVSSAFGTEKFLETLKDVEVGYDSTIEIYNSNGDFVYSSLVKPDNISFPLSTAEKVDEKYKLSYATTSGSIESGSRGFLIKEYVNTALTVDFLVCFNTFDTGDRVEICMQVSQVSSSARLDFVITFVVIMMALVLSLLIIAAYIRRFARPIQNMCGITDKMAKLDFSEKCPPTKLLEITQLSDSINQMSVALDTALKGLQANNDKLLADIEAERTIDNLRQTFISGISHELKTPIAIIQGYAEGAKMFYASGNTEAADKYCTIIMDEAIRMNNMIMKLLEITKYDSGAYEPVRENFDINELADDWFRRNSSIISENGVHVVNDIDPSYLGNGDTIILSSVINNYLSNAMSHVEGEKIVRAFCEDTGDKYRIYIFNTGKQIAEKDIDKIWTSFYRADKSLSRSQGRFGLGLAIVSSIQRLHGEKFGVRNEKDGVSFWFDVNKASDYEPTAAKPQNKI